MSESLNTPAAAPHRRSALRAFLVVLLPGAAIFAGLYYGLVHKPAREYRRLNEQLVARTVGLADNPAPRKLAAGYADANADLVADPPADAAKLADPGTLVFSWIAEEETGRLRDAFKDLTDRLATATGKRVEYALDLRTPEEQLKAVRDGRLHVAAFSTGAVPIAVEQTGFVPVAMLAGDTGGGKHRALVIVPAGGPVRTPADLSGRELALTDPTSNSGFKAPIVLLRNEHGLLPERDYRIRNTLGYDDSITGLAKGQYDAAAVASDVLERAVAAGKIKASDYRVVFTSADFPSAAVGYAHSLKPDLAAKVREALLGFTLKGTSAEAWFASSHQTRFIPVDYKNDWITVRLIDAAMTRPYRLK